MTAATSQTLGDPIDLPLPEPWPKPHPGCGVCGSLAEERAEARRAGDYSKVSDCNVEIRAHQAPHLRRQP